MIWKILGVGLVSNVLALLLLFLSLLTDGLLAFTTELFQTYSFYSDERKGGKRVKKISSRTLLIALLNSLVSVVSSGLNSCL